MISDRALRQFNNIWKEEFGHKISDEIAIESAVALLTLFNIVYKPIKKEWEKNETSKNKT